MFRFTGKPSSESYSQYLAKNYTLGSMRVHRARTRRCQCYGCVLWPVRRVYTAQTPCISIEDIPEWILQYQRKN